MAERPTLDDLSGAWAIRISVSKHGAAEHTLIIRTDPEAAVGAAVAALLRLKREIELATSEQSPVEARADD